MDAFKVPTLVEQTAKIVHQTVYRVQIIQLVHNVKEVIFYTSPYATLPVQIRLLNIQQIAYLANHHVPLAMGG